MVKSCCCFNWLLLFFYDNAMWANFIFDSFREDTENWVGGNVEIPFLHAYCLHVFSFFWNAKCWRTSSVSYTFWTCHAFLTFSAVHLSPHLTIHYVFPVFNQFIIAIFSGTWSEFVIFTSSFAIFICKLFVCVLVTLCIVGQSASRLR